MKRVLIVGSSKQPIPAVNGGAVPTLIEEIIHQNENNQNLKLSCISLYDVKAEEESKKYKHTDFIWAKVPIIVSLFDKSIAKLARKSDRAHSFSFAFQIVWFAFFVAKVLHQNNYDAVIFENSIPVLFSLKLYKNGQKYKQKWYLHMHTVPRGYYGLQKVLMESRKIIVISEYVKKTMIGQLNFSSDRFIVMLNCLPDYFYKTYSKEEIDKVKDKLIPKSKRKKIILYAGRLNKEKGIDEVIPAVENLNINDWILLIVGSNFYKTDIKSQYDIDLRTKAENIKDKIIFTGYIDNNIMPIVYRLADVVVLPSMWDEPAGMTMIETLICERPLITTYSGGIPEYVGKDGCIILKRDNNLQNEITTSIRRIFEDPFAAEKMAQRGKQNVSKYTENYYYEQLIKILTD